MLIFIEKMFGEQKNNVDITKIKVSLKSQEQAYGTYMNCLQ